MTYNKSFVSRIYLFAVTSIVIWLLVDRGSDMFDLFSASNPVLLVFLVAFAVLPFFANTAFWTIALRELGEDITWRQVNEAAIKTTLTRYLPGGIWLFASRSLALKNEGVATHSLIVLFGLENLLAIPIAVLIGSMLLATSSGFPAWMGWVSLSLLATIAVSARPTLDRFMTWWSKRKGLDAPKKILNSGILKMYLSLFLYWLVFGTVFYTYLRSVGQSIDWATAVGGFSLFWRISLFAPFAPHGLGVFEPSFIALADWTMNALLLVGAFRIVLLLRDLLLTGIAGFFIKKSSQG
tara:strand:- start:2169 stop:3053 length:885 start_codon:yes stop_codon:yes gene_type:complete